MRRVVARTLAQQLGPTVTSHPILEALLALAQNASPQIVARGGLIPKGKLKERFNLFSQGRWEDLINASQQCDAEASKASSLRRRTQQGDYWWRNAPIGLWIWSRWVNVLQGCFGG